jgi:O-succinylbenzoic acid--CoA ligase
MSKPLAVVPANDTVAALLVMADVITGNKAIFVSPAVVNGEQATFDAVPETVEDNIAAIVESSGSTGTPKRISISTQATLKYPRS